MEPLFLEIEQLHGNHVVVSLRGFSLKRGGRYWHMKAPGLELSLLGFVFGA